MGIASIVNGVGNIVNTLCDLSPKSFYSIADFYNFIKKRLNAPMARKHFTMVPRPLYFNIDGGISKIWEVLFTDANLAKFAITAQNIKYLNSVGYSGGNKIETTFGNYIYTPNENYSKGGTFEIDFLLTALPIIESFIVPWFYLCNRTNYTSDGNLCISKKLGSSDIIQGAINTISKSLGFDSVFSKTESKNVSQFPVPKLTLDIKFYRMDLIAGLLFLMNPTFVYRLSGVYPIAFSPPRAEHSPNLSLSRNVKFNYNSIICIPGPKYLQILTTNTNIAFAYKDMSPIQILNALNLTIGSAMSIVNDVKGMF